VGLSFLYLKFLQWCWWWYRTSKM